MGEASRLRYRDQPLTPGNEVVVPNCLVGSTQGVVMLRLSKSRDVFGTNGTACLLVMALTAASGVLATATQADEPPTLKTPPAKDWKIEIVPGPAIGPSPVPKARTNTQTASSQGAANKAEPGDSLTSRQREAVTADGHSALPPGISATSYIEVYQSIPFRRSEYLANPNYRHEATMELLLGQLRSKTIVTATAAPNATCCTPRATTLVGFFNPWGAKNYYYHHSYSRPSSSWVW